MKRILLLISLYSCAFSYAQTISDGLMMPARNLCTGFVFTQDKWTTYWEGNLRRENGNIGSVTTQSIMWVGNYGVTDNLNVIAMVPHVKTQASQGTLSGMEGFQDLTLAVKYNFFKKDIGEGKARAFGSVAFSTPMTDYTPDFLPLSIGLNTTNLSYRLTGYYRLGLGVYANVSGAYTWRSNATLDRPAYFTDGNQYLTDEVKMPNVFDYVVNIGYHKGPFQVDLNYTQQNTLGGGDIRRQDMPFVSNRMNYSKIGAFAMYYVAKPKGLAVRAGSMFTADGRNVGKSTSLTGGILYTIGFAPPKTI